MIEDPRKWRKFTSDTKGNAVVMCGKYLLDQTEVIDELSLSLSQLVDYLFKSCNECFIPITCMQTHPFKC